MQIPPPYHQKTEIVPASFSPREPNQTALFIPASGFRNSALQQAPNPFPSPLQPMNLKKTFSKTSKPKKRQPFFGSLSSEQAKFLNLVQFLSISNKQFRTLHNTSKNRQYHRRPKLQCTISYTPCTVFFTQKSFFSFFTLIQS
jgi:hypothetical protein